MKKAAPSGAAFKLTRFAFNAGQARAASHYLSGVSVKAARRLGPPPLLFAIESCHGRAWCPWLLLVSTFAPICILWGCSQAYRLERGMRFRETPASTSL